MSKFYSSRADIEGRIRFLCAAALASIALLLLGLVYYQIIKGNEYVSLASRNRLRILRVPPPRGIITDINGAPLAVNVRTFNINGYPVDLKVEENIKTISSVLVRNGIPMTSEKLKELVDEQYLAPYRAITIASNLTLAQVAGIVMDADFPAALFLVPVWKRSYPAAQYAAHVVGYVAAITRKELSARQGGLYRGGDIIGKNGVEAVYEDDLRGEAGEEIIEVDSRGRKLRDINTHNSQRGHDMVLTIDLAAQRYAAELMKNYRGAVVVMDVEDGSVRCLYSSPSYDPNPLTWGISNQEWAELTDHIERPMMNRAISGSYPPASTFKLITGTAVLEGNVVTTETKIFCPGNFKLGSRVFRCWKRSGHGTENIITALRDSCDVYFYQSAAWLGIDGLVKTARKYGVGSRTGIDLTGESRGNDAGPAWKKKHIKENWYGGDTVNYSIGQGYVLMTPLQVARAYAAVANGGRLLTPRVNALADTKYRRLGVSDQIINILRKGFLEAATAGTGRKSSMYGVKIAGKTGTAQNPHGDDHAWFVGYAPADRPRYVAVAIAEAGKAGSSVTGPIVGKMLNFVINGVKYAEPQPASKKQAQDGL